ncbi:hypothetical protein ACWV95_11560 [Streptomyces albus]
MVAALAMLAVTGEYATGSATTAFLCVPDRVRLLAAKSLTLGAVTFAAGLLCGVVGLVCGLVTLENSTFDTATVCGQVLGVGVHAALLSVLTVGLAAVVRRSAGTVTALFGLLFLLPMALDVLPGAETAVDLLPAGASEAPAAGRQRQLRMAGRARPHGAVGPRLPHGGGTGAAPPRRVTAPSGDGHSRAPTGRAVAAAGRPLSRPAAGPTAAPRCPGRRRGQPACCRPPGPGPPPDPCRGPAAG